MSDLIFYWIGVSVSLAGGFALCGFIAWWGIEKWIAFAGVKRALLEYHWSKLKKQRDSERTGG